MTAGRASADGTARYAERFPEAKRAGFYRPANGCLVSSLGIGTYLGGMDERTDQNYAEAVRVALLGGINFVDTSLNYRLQRSELSVGAAIYAALGEGRLQRDEFVVATKAGYLVPNAMPTDALQSGDVVGGMHSMAPAFLADQLERSRKNLGIETIDIFYLHNPETQMGHLPEDETYSRFRKAFEALERLVEEGKIGAYGAATWQAFREPPGSGKALSLVRLLELAREAGGDGHHFRFIQLPFNLAMAEARARKYERLNGEPMSVLDVAARAGVTVVASATLLQAKLARGLPDGITAAIEGETDAHRAIQFTRSTPGITAALVGMSRAEHVEENLRIAPVPPLSEEDFRGRFASLF